MTQVSAEAMAAMFAQQTDEVFLSCLTISHPDLAESIRVVNDQVDLVRSAGTFLAYPFEVNLPSSQDGQLPEVQLRIDNVSPTILESIRALDQDDDLKCKVEVVLASTPDVVESGPFDFTIRDIGYNALVITTELSFEDILNDEFPKDKFTPTNSPGLF